MQKTATAGFAHAPGATTIKISSGDEIATPLSSFQLGSIITGFPRGLRMEKSSAALLPVEVLGAHNWTRWRVFSETVQIRVMHVRANVKSQKKLKKGESR